MPNQLTPDTIDHMALVFGQNDDGRRFAPRNQSARVISVKSGEVVDLDADPEPKPNFLQRLFSKGMWIPDGAVVPDKIDGDGDGAEDYDWIAQLLSQSYSDISSSWMVSNDAARTALVVAVIDAFLANLDDVRSGGDGKVVKAGKRHSAQTIAKLDELKGMMGAAADKIGALMDETEKGGELDDDPGEDLADGETPESIAVATDEFLKEPK